ncbi:hypothetical protein NDU88_005100 [Pleurodeles waltl]|uniref:Uncharacterized protein n=1 Tax=Pleurodeles waltl TaxID=8319 RepID=A0AAV7MWG9_PLEWA|nr:hypothetical protein NDU88_005100 [Pleurodeles waltl]
MSAASRPMQVVHSPYQLSAGLDPIQPAQRPIPSLPPPLLNRGVSHGPLAWASSPGGPRSSITAGNHHTSGEPQQSAPPPGLRAQQPPAASLHRPVAHQSTPRLAHSRAQGQSRSSYREPGSRGAVVRPNRRSAPSRPRSSTGTAKRLPPRAWLNRSAPP